MPRLISPGVSVDVEDRSLYISGRLGTVPLVLVATADEKLQPDGLTPAIGTYEHGVIRTVTSARQALELYGIPRFLYSADGRPHHGDVRNEYGLDAVFKALEVSDRVYVIRANVNLNDDPEFIREMWERKIEEANASLSTLFDEWLQVQNQDQGFVPGDAGFITEVPRDVTEVLIRQSLSSVFNSYSFSKDNFEAAFLDDTTAETAGYVDIFFNASNGFVDEDDVTGLDVDETYTATFRIAHIGGISETVVSVLGEDAQTFGQLADQVADQLASVAVVDFFLGRIRVTSNLTGATSRVEVIADGGGTTSLLPLFSSTNLFLRIGQPVNGRGGNGYELYNEDYTLVIPGSFTGLLSYLNDTSYTSAQAQGVLLSSALTFTLTKAFLNLTALGSTDAERRQQVVVALRALANDPRTEIRTDGIDYDLIACPGFPELTGELYRITNAVFDEVFVIGETPFNLPPTGPDGITAWARDPRKREVNTRDVGYWYGHGISSNLDGREVLTTAASIALRVILFSDRESDVFWAPAGVQRGLCPFIRNVGYVSGTLGGPTTFVTNFLDRGTRDSLYEFPVNINPITSEVGFGFVVYGQKTAQGFESALDRINVSRLVKRMKRVIRRALRPFVFEPNDQLTRDLVKASTSGYLSTLLGRRALQDYAVQCDERNNPPETVGANELYVDIAIKPTTAVEFIYARIIVVRQDADLSPFR